MTDINCLEKSLLKEANSRSSRRWTRKSITIFTRSTTGAYPVTDEFRRPFLFFFSFRAAAPIWALAYLHETLRFTSVYDLRHSVGLLGRVISSSHGLYLYTNTEKRAHTQTPNIHALSGIRTHDPGFRVSETVHALYRSATVIDQTTIHFIWMLSWHLCLGIRSSLFPTIILTKINCRK
jgi:hypothetical protein